MQFPKHIANFGLPLLAKELTEQAARKRTYVVRVVYAVLLFFTAFLFFYESLRVGSTSPLAVLGRGKDMFSSLVFLQFTGIYFFMPAMTCSLITHEKERASLQLLFLTRLGPWAILFEKLTSRLIPMFGFLLLSLPLLAFAYSLGGISPAFLIRGVWLLVLAVIQMGTLALACSAWFRTTVGAFVWSYLLAIAMFFGPALGWLLVYSLTGKHVYQIVPQWGFSYGVFELPLFGPVFFGPGGGAAGAAVSFSPLIFHSVLVLATSSLCLILARVFIVRRAFVPPGNVVLSVFKRLDRIFLRLNDNPITKGRTIVGDTLALPVDEPVAWRETAKRSLGKGQYLLRIFIALELPVAALCLMTIFASENAASLSLLLLPVGVVSVLMVSVHAASLIAGERSHQTLDVLCTTPLLSRDIIQQKFRSVRRLMLVLLIPFLTIFFFKCAMQWGMPDPNWRGYGRREFSLPLYLTCSLLTVGVYLPMFAWLSLYIGLRVKTQARAIIGALGAILAWCVGPLLFIILPIGIIFQPSLHSPFGYLFLLSPAMIMAFNETNDWPFRPDNPWIAVVVNFAAYGFILFLLRRACYAHADRRLGRVGVDEASDHRDESFEIPRSSEIEECLTEK